MNVTARINKILFKLSLVFHIFNVRIMKFVIYIRILLVQSHLKRALS